VSHHSKDRLVLVAASYLFFAQLFFRPALTIRFRNPKLSHLDVSVPRVQVLGTALLLLVIAQVIRLRLGRSRRSSTSSFSLCESYVCVFSHFVCSCARRHWFRRHRYFGVFATHAWSGG